MLMDPYALENRAGLPDALQALIDTIPRSEWDSHPNFGGLVQFWMERHLMFRRVTETLHSDAQSAMSGKMERAVYNRRLQSHAGLLLNGLHEHHHIEDHHYFPQLVGIAPEIERALDLLEADHEAIDPMLSSLADHMTRVLREDSSLAELDEVLVGFNTLLDRHLVDEEEVVVPVVLKYGFTG
ncbi:MAG: hemerythrin domain-containing protein [Pseudomonadota bacterium]